MSIALDLVLLPPEELWEESVKLSQKLNAPIVLDKDSVLPHISLAMGSFADEDIPKISKEIEQIEEKPMFLILSKVYVKALKDTYISGIQIEKAPELDALHKTCIDIFNKFQKVPTTDEMIYGDPQEAKFDGAEELTKQWIDEYEQTSAHDKFNPHITLGFGKVDGNLSGTCMFNRLALVQMGYLCTARRIIHEHKLT